MKKLLILLSLLTACNLLTACKDDITDSVVPEYAIHYSCNMATINAVMQQTKQPGLDTPGGYVRIFDKKTISAGDIIGLGGLLILQSYERQFFAYDLACPHCFQEDKMVRLIDIDEDGTKAVCDECKSEFGAVFWGSPAPTAGYASAERLILRQYKAIQTGDGTTIVIVNQ